MARLRDVHVTSEKLGVGVAVSAAALEEVCSSEGWPAASSTHTCSLDIMPVATAESARFLE
jgi:hypothetical protein